MEAIDIICPTCHHHSPTPEQERTIRQSERALVLGAALAYVADARSAMMRAEQAMPQNAARADLKRCMRRLDDLLGQHAEPVVDERRGKAKAA